jgi:hypothetical protein
LPPPSLLDEQQTGIRELARYLTTPAVCGIYLSRDTLGNIAQHLQLPRGFGSRQQLLENLFHAAAQYDATADLLGALYDIATSWAQEFEDALVESLNGFSDPWQAQAATTCRLLEDMRQRAATLLE